MSKQALPLAGAVAHPVSSEVSSKVSAKVGAKTTREGAVIEDGTTVGTQDKHAVTLPTVDAQPASVATGR